MWPLILLVILIILFIIWYITIFSKGKNEVKEIENNIRMTLDEVGIKDDAYWSSRDLLVDRMVLSINEITEEVIIVKIPKLSKEYRQPDVQKIKFQEIIEVKVISNSNTVTSTSRVSQVGGALVGGVLAGGVGALIGGLSGQTKSKETIKDIKLEIVVNNISNPIIEVPFYETKISELKSGTPKYEQIIKEINLWYRKFTVILHKQSTLK
ncbi:MULTISPECIES: hypothetical protein [unclassified Lysinibacillus]|uniref:hypothetical protein n=1 Tax=unclassified Lysinibacillus TaxID=2636778 RepID=UPI002FD02C7F